MLLHLEIVAEVENVNFWIGLVLNLLLCSFAYRSKQKSLDRYKYLLILFAINDIAYSIVQYILVMRVITTEYIFSIFLIGQFKYSRAATVFYASFYTLSFVLLDYQFLYRYWAIKSPERLNLFTTAKFQAFLALLAALEFSAWYGTCYSMVPNAAALSELVPLAIERYGLGDPDMGWMVSDYYRNGTYNFTAIMGAMGTSSILSSCFGVMIFAAVSINHRLGHTTVISDKARAMQRQLLYTLCAQTAVPFVFFYVPCGISINLPLTGITIPYLSDFMPLLVSCFPVLDAAVVMLLIPDFRGRLGRMIGARKLSEIVGKTSSANVIEVKPRNSVTRRDTTLF